MVVWDYSAGPVQSYRKDDRSGRGCKALPIFIEYYMHGADLLQGCVLYVLNHGSVGLPICFCTYIHSAADYGYGVLEVMMQGL